MSTFNKKHYERVAEVLRQETLRPLAHLPTIDEIFNKFARMFEEDNSKFSDGRFYHEVWYDKGDEQT